MPRISRCLAEKAVIATGTDSIASSRFWATTVSSPTMPGWVVSVVAAAVAAEALDAHRLAATAKAEPPHNTSYFTTGLALPLGFLEARLFCLAKSCREGR